MSVSTISSAVARTAAEVGHELARARVAVRLERDHDARRRRRPGGGEHGRDLGRMVAVVVDHRDAVDHATHLEAALGAGELLERAGDDIEGDAELEAHRHRRQRVQHRVAAGHLQA